MRAACSARTAAAPSITSACTAGSTSRSARCRRRSARSAATSPATRNLIEFLYHRARPFLFSTSHPPAVAAACMAALDVLMEEPEIIERLWDNTRFFKAGLQRLGFNTGLSESPITPVIAGDGAKAMKLSDRLFERGRLRAGDRLPDRRARQGARPHDRHRDAHARGPAVRARRVRGGRAGARPDLACHERRPPGRRDRHWFDAWTRDIARDCHGRGPAAALHPRHARRLPVLHARPRRRSARAACRGGGGSCCASGRSSSPSR